MRKFIALIALALTMVFAQQADAQIKFGLKGGLNVTNMKFSSDLIKSDNRAGFYVGPTVKFTLPLIGLGVDAAALYDQRSAEIKSTGESLTQKQIAIPINLRYSVGLGSMADIFFYAGPQFGFNVAGDLKDINWKWKDSNISVNVGLGVTLISHLQVNANYNIACGKTGEFNAGSVFSGSSKYNAWQVGVAYYF